MLQLIQ
ncbi:hypothetical protein YPPY90_2800, partial [Yersinia pestis PY-90]